MAVLFSGITNDTGVIDVSGCTDDVVIYFRLANVDVEITFDDYSEAPYVNTDQVFNLTDLGLAGVSDLQIKTTNPNDTINIDVYCYDENKPLNCWIVKNNDVTTVGGSDGSISVQIEGGVVPYRWKWDDLQDLNTPLTRDDLSAGTYSIAVGDANDDVTQCQVTINEPGNDPLSCTITKNNDATCNGDADGSATVSGSGGTSPYTYLWDIGGSDKTHNNLPAGTHTVTVTDANDDTTQCQVTINEPDELKCSITKNNDVTEHGGSDGSATVSGSGGTSPYTYLWDDNSTGATNNNLDAGTHSVTITDSNGCENKCQVTINQPKPSDDNDRPGEWHILLPR